jgi:hypothetical protein
VAKASGRERVALDAEEEGAHGGQDLLGDHVQPAGFVEEVERFAGWLEQHWSELLPRARGKFIAVAGSEGLVADTVQAAWAWIAKNHPSDGGAFVRYVPAVPGPRIYANRRYVA